jgi:hypothetical protein
MENGNAALEIENPNYEDGLYGGNRGIGKGFGSFIDAGFLWRG